MPQLSISDENRALLALMASNAESLRLRSPPLRDPVRLLNPAVRAYMLGLLSTTSPKLVSVLVSTITGKVQPRDAIQKLRALFAHQTQPDKFAAICGILVGGSTLFPIPLLTLLARYQKSTNRFTPGALQRLILVIKLLSSAFAAHISFNLLNRKESKAIKVQRRRRKSTVTFNPEGLIFQEEPPADRKLAGRTLDLTLFGAVRAADIVIVTLWYAFKNKPVQQRTPGKRKLPNISDQYVAPTLFAFSSCIVMWAWFYTPERLPRTYNHWISNAANIDSRLIKALNECRQGTFYYGKDTGWAPLLSGMCRELGLPEVWADPAKTIPIPCELYHSGTGRSCEWHAMSRFATSFKFAMQMYLPLNLLMLVRRKPASRSIMQALYGASRSSAFLAAFVSFFYYGVCLTRTRIGPKILPKKYCGPNEIDGGLCIGTGCFACGWSILLENPARRNEIAFFVAPRALATVFPRRYLWSNLWKERLAFVASAAVILTAAQVKPDRVRGVFGRLLDQVFV